MGVSQRCDWKLMPELIPKIGPAGLELAGLELFSDFCCQY